MTDEERERQIAKHRELMVACKWPGGKAYHWVEIRRLIFGRSQQQIAKMERGMCGEN